jgi:hypothetical protein
MEAKIASEVVTKYAGLSYQEMRVLYKKELEIAGLEYVRGCAGLLYWAMQTS